jgi:hypothetical protein
MFSDSLLNNSHTSRPQRNKDSGKTPKYTTSNRSFGSPGSFSAASFLSVFQHAETLFRHYFMNHFGEIAVKAGFFGSSGGAVFGLQNVLAKVVCPEATMLADRKSFRQPI